MLVKSYIQSNLKALDVKFRKSNSPKDNLFYSKLAILELCGWLEESIDTVVRDCAKRHIKTLPNIAIIESEIKRNYGFSYDKNFKLLLSKVIGIVVFERIEGKIDSQKLQLFTSTISTLVTKRNSEAHTHIRGVAKTIDAPSVTIVNFNNLYNGLLEFESELKTLVI